MAKGVIQSTILSSNGSIAVAAGATITILDSVSGLPATLYVDRDGVTPKANPFTAGVDGFFRVYADPGTYDIEVVSGSYSRSYLYVPVFEDGFAEFTIDYFTEGRNVTAPNAAQPVHEWNATAGDASIDIALKPKGSGALLVDTPDSTATGGNKRGQKAVDLQRQRDAAAQAATGAYAVIGGGRNNTVSGQDAVISGGKDNTASGLYSSVPGGANATTRGLTGRQSMASGRFAADGDAQLGRMVQRFETADATPSRLTADAQATDTSNVAVLPDDHAYAITARVIGFEPATGDAIDIEVRGTIKRGTGAASVALVGTPLYTIISQSAGAATWDVTLEADTTNGSAEIEVTGEAAKTIHWVATIDTVEVG